MRNDTRKHFCVLTSAFACFALAFFILWGGVEQVQAQITCPYTLPDTPTDRDYLIRFYCATDGNNWTTDTNWLTDLPISEWHGISVSSVNQEVTTIDLSENQLRGEIPAELGNLTTLNTLFLWGNQLSGTIPTELGNLTHTLQFLSLSQNQLSGTIPTELGNLAALDEFYIWGNQLSGTIPAELGNVLGLDTLSLSRNQLSGTIPTELGSLADLDYLYLNSNQLSGTIPTELGSLTRLTEFYIWGNQLSGAIPTELGSLTRLTHLSLSRNQLSGAIPTELGSLTKLTHLYLNNNQLTGDIPAELGSLTKLTHLYLNNNELSGTISTGLVDGTVDLLSLEVLNLSNNQLSGEITGQIGNLTTLKEIYLNNNQFSGLIPPELAADSFSKLTHLYLNNNKFQYSIPAFYDVPNLKYLYVNDNNLSGELDTTFGFAAAPLNGPLQELGLWGNPELIWTTTLGFTGDDITALSQIVDRAALRSLYENNNGANWRSNDNWLDSENPFSFGDWHGVTTNDDGRVSELNLANNGLTGEITNALEVMGGLENLNLSHNRALRGTLPVRLRQIEPLASLDTRCTGVSVPTGTEFEDAGVEFRDWLRGISFRGTCPPPPPPPAVIGDTQGVRGGEETENGFPLTLEEEGYFVYRQRRINLSVTRNAGVSSDYNPAVTIPRAILDRVLRRGEEITLELSEISGDSPQAPPSGFRLAGYAAEIDLGVELAAGETVTVCLPPAQDEGKSDIYHYDETEGVWELLEGSRPQNVNGDDMVCGEADAFSLFGVFLPVIGSAQGVSYSEETENGFPLTPLGEGGNIFYGDKTISLSVTQDECPSPDGNPAVIVSRVILDRVEEITFELFEDSPQAPPPGLVLTGCAAEIDLGVELLEGETVTVCLPSAGSEEEPGLHHYDETEGWELPESRLETVNGEELVCRETGAFSLSGVFVEKPSSGCAVAAADVEGSGSVFNLLLIVSVLLVTAGRNQLRP